MRSTLGFILFAAMALLPQAAAAQVVTRNVEVKAHFNDYPQGVGYGYSSCWSYVHGDGREYAVIGTRKGTAFYNVTDPDNAYFVGFIDGISSTWREMKSYRNWVYIVTESVTPAPGDPPVAPGIQIVSMTDPEHPALVATWAGSFNRSHTVSVDTTRALLICNGTRSGNVATGMRILSLANPVGPVEIGWWPGGATPVPTDKYVHDSVPIGTRLYASSIYVGIQRVIDLTIPSTPTELVSWTYPGGFSHNAWPDATGNILYVTDEVNGEPLKIFDLTGLPPSPPMVNRITSNPGAIVHNAHVLGDELILANYTEGTRFLDISDPRHPAEYAWADTWLGPSGGFSGVWGVCPYFPSGTVIASDMQSGLWVYRPVRDYGIVHAQVTDGALPMSDVRVFLLAAGDSATTTADGVVRFAPNPGTHTLKAVRFGYHDATVTLPVGTGAVDTVTLVMTPKLTASLSGVLIDHGSFAPLDGGQVDLRYSPVHHHTEADGAYALADVPADLYRVEVRRPGYIGIAFDRDFPAGASDFMDFEMFPTATRDPVETGTGWTVGAPGDNATSGIWTRVEPLGTSNATGGGADARAPGAPGVEDIGPVVGIEHEGHEDDGAAPGQAAPETDRSPDGAYCWVTGQGTNPASLGEADVDEGRTSLTSPALNLSAMADPVVAYWGWFYTQFGHEDDWLAVLISNDNGASWTPVDTLRSMHNHWLEYEIHVSDHVAPTSQVRLRFQAHDGFGLGTVVEAGVDELVTYDRAALLAAGEAAAPRRLALRSVGPNPARGGQAAFALDSPSARDAEVAVFDVTGRRVRLLWRGRAEAGTLRIAWDGAGDDGRAAPAGLYFARATARGEVAEARIIRVR